MRGNLRVKRAMAILMALGGVSVLGSAWAMEPEPGPGPETATNGPASYWVYVGTYSGGKANSEGIYLLELDMASGKLSSRGLAAKSVNPSFLAVHPSRKFLYAVSEVATGSGKKVGGVSAFTLDARTGALGALNGQSSGGAGPCHVVVDKAGKNVLVANYGGGSAEVIPIQPDGRLAQPSCFVQHEGKGADPGRQSEPHAHSVNLDAAGKFAFVADLGLDKVLVYRFDAENGTITANDPPSASVAPASGPRHFAFHPDGRHAYVINEMKSTVTAFDYDPERGVLREIQTISTLPEGYTGTSYTAEVVVHPSGKFLYGSNRGHDSLAVFRIDGSTGKLSAVGHTSTGGKNPRNFNIDPTGKYVLACNQGSDTIVVFRVDAGTGKLEPTGQTLEVPIPVCVKFVPKAE